jgi:hypothetical protein
VGGWAADTLDPASSNPATADATKFLKIKAISAPSIYTSNQAW